MTSYKEALNKILKVTKINKKKEFVKNLKNETLCENIYSKKDNPSYNNSFILDNSTGWTHTYSAINGDIFVYTAKDATYNSTGNVGTAFVFEKDDTTGWKDITTKYKLVPSDTSVTNFGNYVVMDSNNIIITQENYNSNRGAVYVYQKNYS